ncbi:hypothetical protein DFH07DRAFT_797924 [Mycena maculata]|uniref:F-box domain-containing protein n=1 Tax=Mycena maculata TaxID=230809 RepID=A0AAD7NVH2_9AGAR|nr:hypothetical protein DFH07DRAFT_797924 [Mycena maculata]
MSGYMRSRRSTFSIDSACYHPSTLFLRQHVDFDDVGSGSLLIGHGMKNHLVQAVDRARQGFKRTRSGSFAPSQLLLVPAELWLKIFSYLSAPSDIKALTLTCHCFRQYAQPLLFAKISTHPAPPTLAIRSLQMNKYRQRTSQRLEFFLSPLIAPAVRECWIDPPSPEDDDLPTDVLIDAIFDGLCKLPNLKVLGCRSIRFTPNRLVVLQRLALTTMTLESCLSDLTDFTNLPPIPLASATFKYSDVMSQDDTLPPLLSLFLSPRHLQRLSATTPAILLAIPKGRPFGRLLYLELPVECLVSDLLIPALSHCPAVERITLQMGPDGNIPRSGVIKAIPDDILPHLKLYRGPRNFAALFASSGRLQTIEISVAGKAHRLLRTLSQIHATLDYLSFRVDGPVPKNLFEAVHTMFPTLRTLSINDPPMSNADVLALLSGTTPRPNMRVFRIRIEGRDRYNLWIPPMEEAADAVECFKKVHDELERVYPNLLTLKLLYGVEGGSVVWRRSGATGELVRMPIKPL